MNDDRLRMLLAAADGDAELPRPTERLAAKVEARVRRTAAIRRRAARAALWVIFAGGAWAASRFLSGSQNPAHEQVAGSNGSAATTRGSANASSETGPRELSSQVALHEKAIAELLNAETASRRQMAITQLLARPDPLDELDEANDRAARIIFDRGDRLAREPGRGLEAANAYRRVLELFPDSRAAADAQRRIAQIRG